MNDQIITGVTPLSVAECNCRSEILRYLIERTAVSTRTSHWNKGCVAELTPLQAAFYKIASLEINTQEYRELKEIINLLVKSGANPSDTTKNGAPIWSMEWCNNVDSITTLINLGMSLTQRCPREGTTVLHHWISQPMDQVGFLEVIRLLLDKGADVESVDNDGLTPVISAVLGKQTFSLQLGSKINTGVN